MKRSGFLKRKTPLKRSSASLQRIPLRKVSAKTKVRNAEYSEQGRAFLERVENQFCSVMRELYGLFYLATEAHHSRGRSGKNMLDESTWIPVSRAGHDWLHQNPVEAKKRGWMLSRSGIN